MLNYVGTYWPIWLIALLWIVVTIGPALGLRWLVDRRGVLSSEDDNTLAVAAVTVVGALFAVLSAFVLVAQWDNFNAAKDEARVEAYRLLELREEAEDLAPPHEDLLTKAIDNYAQSAIKEFTEMRLGVATFTDSSHVKAVFDEIIALEKDPSANVSGLVLNRLAGIFQEVDDSRSRRLGISQNTFPDMLVLALIATGLATIVATAMFRSPDRLGRYTLSLLIAFMVGSTLFLITLMDNPYSGIIRVSPDIFLRILHLH